MRLCAGFTWDSDTEWSNPHVNIAGDGRLCLATKTPTSRDQLGVCARQTFSQVSCHRYLIRIRANVEDCMYFGIVFRGNEKSAAPDWDRMGDFCSHNTMYFAIYPRRTFQDGSIGLYVPGGSGTESERFHLPDASSLLNRNFDQSQQTRTVDFSFELDIRGHLQISINGHLISILSEAYVSRLLKSVYSFQNAAPMAGVTLHHTNLTAEIRIIQTIEYDISHIDPRKLRYLSETNAK